MGKDREKEIRYLMYLKNEIIKNEKKEIKKLREELNMINAEKQKTKVKRKR